MIQKLYKFTSFCLFFLFLGMTKISAQGDFITVWDMSKSAPLAYQNSIVFGVNTSGIASYTWETYPVASVSGLGTFTGTTLTVTGIPTNAVIKLSIKPTNFLRININNGPCRSRLIDLLQWGTAQWNTMDYAFYGCDNLGGAGAVDKPDLTYVFSMTGMFLRSSFNHPIGDWDVSQVVSMGGMFGASSFNQPIGNWDVSNVTNMSGMFQVTTAFNQPIGNWNVGKVLNMESMFSYAEAFNQPIGNWNVSSVSNMNKMFYGNKVFNQPIGTWNVSNVNFMSLMFGYSVAFNQPIGTWNVGNVIDMTYMFENAYEFNQPIGTWDMRNMRNLFFMFRRAVKFNQPIGDWNFNNYVTDLSGMFEDAPVFNQSIEKWDVSRIDKTIEMFKGAVSFNQPLGKWNISSMAIQMNGMFNGATSFNQDISPWFTNTFTGFFLSNFLDNSGMNGANYDAILDTLDKYTLRRRITLGAAGVKYCSAGGSRANLVDPGAGGHAWVVNDAGPESTTGSINIVSQPTSSTICAGSNKTFTISATGTRLSYAWGNSQGGIQGSTRTFTTSVPGTYTVTIKGSGCGSAVSNSVSLNTTTVPTNIITSPTSQTVCAKSSALFAVSATGGNLEYIWSNGAANAALMSTTAPGTYTVTVNGVCGLAISSPFGLTTTVCSAPISSISIIFPNTATTTFSGTSANITWPTLTIASTYCIRYSKSANFSTTVKTVCGLNAANYLFVLSTAGLRLADTQETIYYQVAGVDAQGNMSQWSTVQSFELRTGESTGLDDVFTSSQRTIYPNPNNGTFFIKNLIPGSILEVYNLLGAMVYSQRVSSTETTISANLEPGIYQLKNNAWQSKLVIE